MVGNGSSGVRLRSGTRRGRSPTGRARTFPARPCRFNPRRLRRRIIVPSSAPAARARVLAPLEPAQPHQQGGRIPLEGELLGQHGVVGRLAGNRRHQPVGRAQALPAGVEHGRTAARAVLGLFQQLARFLQTGLGLLELAQGRPRAHSLPSLPLASMFERETGGIRFVLGDKEYRLKVVATLYNRPRGSQRSMPGEQESTSTVVETEVTTEQRDSALPPYNVVIFNDEEHTFPYVIELLDQALPASPSQGGGADLRIHMTGRAIVYTTHKELAELKRDQVIAYGPDPRMAISKGPLRCYVEPARGGLIEQHVIPARSPTAAGAARS